VSTPETTAHLTELCAAIREVFGARACCLAVVDHDGGEVEFVAGDGPGSAAMLGVRLPVGSGIAGYVAQTGTPVEIPEVQHDERFLGRFSVAPQDVPSVLLAMPVRSATGAVVGVLQVGDPAPDVLAGAQQTVGSVVPALEVVAAEVAETIAAHTGGGRAEVGASAG
jgi:signal transduction protein with GAF and PtsI domain